MKKIPFTKPTVPNLTNYTKHLQNIFSSGMLTNDGPYLKKLESSLSEFLEVKNSVLVSNATLALTLCLRYLIETDPGKSEVILPSFTFIATAHAVKFLGLNPVFCDVDPTTFTISKNEVLPLVNENTLCVIGVNVYSRPCDFNSLDGLNVPVIYDSAHCFGSSYQGTKFGKNGLAEVFSLHATKVFNTVEGGLITTENDNLAQMLKYYRNFGFTSTDNVGFLGINCKMSELHAAFGLENLKTLNSRLQSNQKNYEFYKSHLPQSIEFLQEIEGLDSNRHYIPILIDKNRDTVYNHLINKNIFARRYFYPGCHKSSPYKAQDLILPCTESITERILCLPNYPELTEEDLNYIIKTIKEIIE